MAPVNSLTSWALSPAPVTSPHIHPHLPLIRPNTGSSHVALENAAPRTHLTQSIPAPNATRPCPRSIERASNHVHPDFDLRRRVRRHPRPAGARVACTLRPSYPYPSRLDGEGRDGDALTKRGVEQTVHQTAGFLPVVRASHPRHHVPTPRPADLTTTQLARHHGLRVRRGRERGDGHCAVELPGRDRAGGQAGGAQRASAPPHPLKYRWMSTMHGRGTREDGDWSWWVLTEGCNADD